ncbi:hypothetical protein HYV10_00155 [Candidatus Dependentiae bacterium]|nr:hypothetical protein [Candidatus Dependentiae bacterium]
MNRSTFFFLVLFCLSQICCSSDSGNDSSSKSSELKFEDVVSCSNSSNVSNHGTPCGKLQRATRCVIRVISGSDLDDSADRDDDLGIKEGRSLDNYYSFPLAPIKWSMAETEHADNIAHCQNDQALELAQIVDQQQREFQEIAYIFSALMQRGRLSDPGNKGISPSPVFSSASMSSWDDLSDEGKFFGGIPGSFSSFQNTPRD